MLMLEPRRVELKEKSTLKPPNWSTRSKMLKRTVAGGLIKQGKQLKKKTILYSHILQGIVLPRTKTLLLQLGE